VRRDILPIAFLFWGLSLIAGAVTIDAYPNPWCIGLAVATVVSVAIAAAATLEYLKS
jgi:hypothetical protein